MASACAAGCLVVAGVASAAFAPVDRTFQVVQTGGGSDSRVSDGPKVAFNQQRREYFVVWRSNGSGGFDVYGQRLSPTGGKVGARVRISNSQDIGSDRGVNSPAVAYGPQAKRYLAVWPGDELANDGEFEIFGQFISDTGVPLGSDFRISNALDSPNGNLSDSLVADVAYNSAANEFLVTWDADQGSVNGQREVWGQRLDPNGTPLGGDFQISNAGAVGSTRIAVLGSVVYNPQANEYLVAFISEAVAESKGEAFGQRLNANGGEIGADFRISQTGLDSDPNRDATRVAVAYDSRDNEYLAVFTADHSFTGFGETPTNNEEEIFGQRLSAGGAEIGANDFRISSVGNPDSSGLYDANLPRVAYAAPANEYLVTWTADEIENAWPEIQGQRLTASGGEIGPDLRITRDEPQQSASVDGDVVRSTAAGEYLSVFLHSTRAKQDYDVYGRRVGQLAKCGGRAAGRQGTRLADSIAGGSGKDVIATLAGKDTAKGGGGPDRLCGGGGKDTLLGGPGNDHLDGGPGKGDRCIGGPGADTFAASCEIKRG
ncbi:MAG TPA: hypothetical protein VKA89_00725 [Solirubrobacterales bacterium]|nr:hypothetical protein [Solirubrobacterales bacterium]